MPWALMLPLPEAVLGPIKALFIGTVVSSFGVPC